MANVVINVNIGNVYSMTLLYKQIYVQINGCVFASPSAN